MSEQELLISSKQKSPIYSSWELELDVVKEGFYGYGYGTTSNFKTIGTATSNTTCQFDISGGVGSVVGIISSGMAFEVGDAVFVTNSTTLDIFSGVISTYNSISGFCVVDISGSLIDIDPPENHPCTIVSADPPSLDYFNVIGLDGDLLGYGYKDQNSPSNVIDFEPSYSYGWGYEYSNFIFADSEDYVVVKARVLKDNIPQEGIKVLFFGSVGVILSPSMSISDEDGYAETKVSINKDLDINQLDGWGSEKFKERIDPQFFRKLTGNGGRTVSAVIFEIPEIDDGNLVLKTESVQRFFSDAVYNLNIGTYAYNEGEDI